MLPSLLPHEDEVEEQANKSQHHSHPSQCWHERKQDDINQEYLLPWYPLWIQIQLMMGGESRGRVSEDERGERQSAVRVSGIEAHMQYSAANSYTYIYTVRAYSYLL